MTTYGIIFFLSTREKRQAKSREAAAKSANETMHACEKWKEVARKGAELGSVLSQTFSRKKSVSFVGKDSKDHKFPHMRQR